MAPPKKDYNHSKKNEFNFTNYINQLKENSKAFGENYVKTLNNKIESEINNKYRDFKGKQNYSKSGYYDNRIQDSQYQDNINNSYYNKGKNDKRSNRGGKFNNSNNNYNYNNKKDQNYDYNYSYTEQSIPLQKPKTSNPNEIFDFFVKQESYNDQINNLNRQDVEVVYSYEDERQGKGKKNKKGKGNVNGTYFDNIYDKNQKEDINTIGLPDKKKKKNRFNKTANENEEDHLNYNTNTKTEVNLYQDQGYLNENITRPTTSENLNIKGNSISNTSMLTMDSSIDYKFVLKSWVLGIREYMKEKILKEDPPDSDFILPSETTYQMIVIIDKLEKQKILELQSIINFGFDLELVKEVRILLLSGFYDRDSINHILNRLETKKILLLYKYLHISSNKLNGLYYKLGITILYIKLCFCLHNKRKN